jgi:hypothetical protein
LLLNVLKNVVRGPALLECDADEAATHGNLGSGGIGCVDEVCDTDTAEEVLDAVVYFAQRFFDGAMTG